LPAQFFLKAEMCLFRSPLSRFFFGTPASFVSGAAKWFFFCKPKRLSYCALACFLFFCLLAGEFRRPTSGLFFRSFACGFSGGPLFRKFLCCPAQCLSLNLKTSLLFNTSPHLFFCVRTVCLLCFHARLFSLASHCFFFSPRSCKGLSLFAHSFLCHSSLLNLFDSFAKRLFQKRGPFPVGAFLLTSDRR
jgi:hypothetical protein